LKLSKPFNPNQPLIRCRCGKEILLVPNVVEMSKAIEDHVEEHEKKIKNRRQAKTEAQEILDDLLAKVLFVASEIEF